MSSDLCWQVIRNNHSHLLKKRNVNKPFSKVRRWGGCPGGGWQALAIPGHPYVLPCLCLSPQNKPVKNLVKTTVKAGPRRALNSIRRFIRHNSYRKDLKMAACVVPPPS
ncbi:60S ribosomal protein L28-like [Portunus trituberculatus]|uniref:60S ribosomal protein L28-like n=1 Tax=Portunus trituberculatus TaxID=210409 RepID=UPI001E1CF845|nr:60S ribosomal protein L28-like [Portunus trituberculatus]